MTLTTHFFGVPRAEKRDEEKNARSNFHDAPPLKAADTLSVARDVRRLGPPGRLRLKPVVPVYESLLAPYSFFFFLDILNIDFEI